jgi:CRISPR-associated protein Csm5
MKTFHLTITTRSPLHIGTGRALVHGYDFVFDSATGTLYVLNDEAVLRLVDTVLVRRNQKLREDVAAFDALPARQQTDQKAQQLRNQAIDLRNQREQLLRGMPLDDIITARLLSFKTHLQPRIDVEGMPLVRYTLQGALSRSSEVNEQIKDVFDRPYLPGSSLKGAIRTALAWQHFSERRLPVNLRALSVRSGRRQGQLPINKEADENYETALFVHPSGEGLGSAANRDLWRAFHVSDSTPADAARLLLAPTTIFGGRTPQPRPGMSQQGFDVLNVEAIAPETTMHATVQISDDLFNPLATARNLRFGAQQDWLEGFTAACRARGEARIAAEQAFFRAREQSTLERFYAGLMDEARSLPANSFMLQLGWGAGWGSKTYDDRLQADPQGFAEIVSHYTLDKPRKPSAFRVGDRFPKTRKLVLNNGQPWQPLGWVRVDVIEQ